MPKAMTGRRSSGIGCAVAILSVFFLAGLGTTGAIVAGPIGRVARARSWRPALCTILFSGLRRHRGKSTTYDVDVLYSWQADGRTFTGNRYDLIGVWTGNFDRWQSIVDGLRPGTRTTCWVDPRDPSQATLVREFGRAGMALMLPSFVIIAVAGLLLWGLVRKRRGGGNRPAVPKPVFVAEPGPVALKPSSTPVTRLVRELFFAGCWNGLVWLVLARPVRLGIGPIVFRLVFGAFLVVFGLIGIYLLFRAARAFLALAEPRVRVTASARTLRLGDKLSVEWSFRGRTEAISAVTVSLVGSEIARSQDTDSDGHRSTTERVRVFARLPIAGLSGASGSVGTGAVTVPTDSVPTFSAPNNEIAWAVVVEAALRHLPDLRERFPIVLLPGAR